MEDRFFRTRGYLFKRETVSYYHFSGEVVVRQLELSKAEIYMMTDKSEISDVSLSESRFEPDDCITAEEFEDAWNAPLALQKKIFCKKTLQSNAEVDEIFIRIWLIIFGKKTAGYYHFVGDHAVRIIEITKTEIYRMNDKYSLKIKLNGDLLTKEVDDSSLKITDAPFPEIKILPENFITAEEFNKVWISPEEEQKRLFGKDV